jgi:SAM-dependent methyltransferase
MLSGRPVRVVARRFLPPRRLWPWGLPGAPSAAELRWRFKLETAPIITGAEHAARTGLLEIEEVIGCSLCGEERMQVLFHPREPHGRWEYHVARCPSCGFLYRHPGIRADRLDELYAGKGYARFLTGQYARQRRDRYALSMDAFAPLLDDGAGRRLLDFGCGAGLFLELAHERGFDGYGVDLSPESVERARERPGGRNAYVGAPHDVPEIAAGGFDVITLWSVMAHLPRPVDDLRVLRGLLAPGGALLILTVNANSLRLKAEGEEWNGFTPNHLKFFSPTTLALALDQAGFPAAVMPPMYSYEVERGRAELAPREERRLRTVIDRGNRGNMLRAAAFTSAADAARWRLGTSYGEPSPRTASSSAVA